MNPQPIQQRITTPLISDGPSSDAVEPQEQQSHPDSITLAKLSSNTFGLLSSKELAQSEPADACYRETKSQVHKALEEGKFELQSSNDKQSTFKAQVDSRDDKGHPTTGELTIEAQLNDQSEYDIIGFGVKLPDSSETRFFNLPSSRSAQDSASSVLSEHPPHPEMSLVLSQPTEIEELGSGDDRIDTRSNDGIGLEAPLTNSSSQAKPVHVGQVRTGDSDKLVSSNPVVHALLSFAQKEEPFPRNVKINERVQLEMRPAPDIKQRLEAFKESFTVDNAQLISTDDPSRRVDEEINADIHIPALLKAIERGKEAFGPGALVTRAGKDPETAQLFLASCAPEITSNDDALSVFITQKLRTDNDLQIRLGAQELLHAATKKEFQLGGLLGSIAVSSGLGSVWELAASTLLKNSIFGNHFSPSKYALQLAGIDSVPPLAIETLDTMCVLAVIKGMKGVQWSISDLLPKALKAGAISSVASFPNNLLQYTGFRSRVGNLAANAVTTEAAIFGAASGIPPELRESEVLMRAGLLQSMKNNVLAHPGSGVDTKEAIKRMTRRALDIAPAESTAIKSMGLASIVGMIPLIASSKAAGLMSESLLRIFRSIVFNPIETIALNALALAGRVSVPGLHNSDNDKHALVLQAILTQASKDMPEGRDISEKELHGKLAPRSELLRYLGSAIVDGMNASFEALPALARKLGYGEVPLAERIPYQDLAVIEEQRQSEP